MGLLRSPLRGRSVVFFTPSWPEADGSAAGVRTERLVRAFIEWGCRVAIACAAARSPVCERLENTHGVSTFSLPLNSAPDMRAVLDATEPDVAVFDRFYAEEAHSHSLQALRPSALRVLDMQDCHSLRLARQRAIEDGGGVSDALRAFPAADDVGLAREMASVLRCDLSLACSPVEERWLRDTCGVPSHKLALAPFFVPPDAADAASRLAGFEARNGFVSLGTFRHPPNVDSIRFLVREIWPMVRQELPDAQLQLVGSNPTREASASFHSPKNGVHLRGYVSPEELDALLGEARVLLAPLRFGAGLKGKVVDAWAHSLPVCTTPIGSEGITRHEMFGTSGGGDDGDGAWGGLYRATDAQSFAADATRLHADRGLWERCSGSGFALRQELFAEEARLATVREALEAALDGRDERRSRDFVGAAMWHHNQRSTEYFSKWIAVKEQLKQATGASPRVAD